jgi:hypothetical protein
MCYHPPLYSAIRLIHDPTSVDNRVVGCVPYSICCLLLVYAYASKARDDFELPWRFYNAQTCMLNNDNFLKNIEIHRLNG